MDNKSKFGVFGLGISGLATMQYLASQKLDFIAYDDQEKTISNISSKYQEFANNLKDLSDPAWQEIDYLILSPGIALTYPKPHSVVELAKKINAKIISDIELFYLHHPETFFIGITGTNGKSTTTALVTHILRYNGHNAVLGGNIGVPILDIKVDKDTICVIETSSFQLDLLDKTCFNIALLLNITPDHLERHGNMQNYTETKYRIFASQHADDIAIINKELKATSNAFTFSVDQQADLTILDNVLYYADKSHHLPYNNSLLGKHNQQNMAAAIACCLKFGLKLEDIIAALPSFVGLKHRMQYLGQYNQVNFINDSKATNADSTSKALDSFFPTSSLTTTPKALEIGDLLSVPETHSRFIVDDLKNGIIWIAGGVAKEGGIESLKSYFPKIKQVLLIGKSQDEFAQTCNELVAWQKCDNLENAFKIACEIAIPGDVVLLSPACASYDQWKNFEERGDAFIQMVEKRISSSDLSI